MMDVVLDVAMLDVIFSYKYFSSFLWFVGFFVVVAILVNVLAPTKSKVYRRILADLYVAGKIKKFADEDEIDLAKEEINFHRWSKRERLRDFSLDNVVEADLNEKIAESHMEKIPKVETPKK